MKIVGAAWGETVSVHEDNRRFGLVLTILNKYYL